jgi:hypothetical protein
VLRDAVHQRPQAPEVPSDEDLRLAILANFANILQNVEHFWRACSRLYQNEFLQENIGLTAFFKLYKICILLHRCNLKILANNRFEKSAIEKSEIEKSVEDHVVLDDRTSVLVLVQDPVQRLERAAGREVREHGERRDRDPVRRT